MALSGLYTTLKDAGSRALTLTQGHPWTQRCVDYVTNHPWTSLGVVTGAYVTWRIVTRPRNLPPGPFNFPIIGAISFMGDDMEKKLFAARKTYGDVIYMKMFGNEIVALNSEKALREGLLKRGEELAARPPSPFVNATISFKDDIFTAPYNDEWKAKKKFIVTALKNFGFGTARSEGKINSGLDKLETVLTAKNGQAIQTRDAIITLTSSLVYDIFFNIDLPLSDPQVAEIAKMTADWSNGFNEGLILCDFLLAEWPLLRRILTHGTVRKARKAADALLAKLKGMVIEHRQSFDPNNLRDIIDYYLLHLGDNSDLEVAGKVFLVLPDSIDTTALAIHWMLYFLAKHQDIQKKLQKEIDDNLGRDRNPTLSDKPNLAYAEAFVIESLRRCNLTPIISGRQPQGDMEFWGYRIPKSARVMGCPYSVHFDPEIFPDPEKFDPMRYIDSEGKFDHNEAGHVITFSLGRRMCMGEQFSKVQLFMTLVRLAQKFNLAFDPNSPEPSDIPIKGTNLFPIPADHKICFTIR